VSALPFIPENIIDLYDTPSTYSGGTDVFLKSTIDGTEWGTYTPSAVKYSYDSNSDTNAFTNYERHKLRLLPEKFQFLTSSGVPSSGTEANFNDVFYSSTTETLYKKEQGNFISSSFTEEVALCFTTQMRVMGRLTTTRLIYIV
jgi:hypothetical protein